MTLITGKFVEFPRLVARNLNMYQAPNLNGDCQAIYSQTLGKNTEEILAFFSQSIRLRGGRYGMLPTQASRKYFFTWISER